MKEPTCKDCQNYIQHYVVRGSKFIEVHWGHCVLSHLKCKRPDQKCCEHFSPGSADTDAFVTKEYLTKKLLDHFLNLGLISDVLDMEQFRGGKEILKE